MAEFSVHVKLVTATCPTCGTLHAFPEQLYNEAQERKLNFSIWCPRGHAWWFTGKSEADKLRLERDRLKQENARLADQHTEMERELGAERKRFAAHRRRINNGVCPCCQRSFVKLAQHMKTKHPGYVEPLKVVSAK